MSEKKKLPIMISDIKKMQLSRTANYLAKNFVESIIPIMFKFGVLDETHIKKYLTCESMEEIYKDALKENPEKIKFMEQMELLNEEDVWAQIRSVESPVKSPKEKGFIFAKMPTSNPSLKSAVKALFVKDGCVFVDEKIIDEESIIKPTEKQQELYEMVADFCVALREKNFHKSLINTLFVNTRNGIQPSISGILGTVWCSVRK